MATDLLLLLLLLQSPSHLISHLKQLLSSTCNKLSTEPGMSIFHHPKIKTKEKLQEISTYVSVFLSVLQKDMRFANGMGSTLQR
jgi:hypothetical protein